MEINLRRVRDIVSIKRTIWSNYDRFRTLGVFYLERNEVLDKICAMPEEEIAKIAAECREGGVRWRSFTKHMNKIESAPDTAFTVMLPNSAESAAPSSTRASTLE